MGQYQYIRKSAVLVPKNDQILSHFRSFFHIKEVKMNIKVNINVPSPTGRWATPHRRERCTLPCLRAEEILHTRRWTQPSCSLMPPPADRRPASLWSPAHRNWSIWTTLLMPNWHIQKEHTVDQSFKIGNILIIMCYFIIIIPFGEALQLSTTLCIIITGYDLSSHWSSMRCFASCILPIFFALTNNPRTSS